MHDLNVTTSLHDEVGFKTVNRVSVFYRSRGIQNNAYIFTGHNISNYHVIVIRLIGFNLVCNYTGIIEN